MATVYTLKAKNPDTNRVETYDKQFGSFSEAYDALCKLYFEQIKAGLKNPKYQKKQYRVYETTISEVDGTEYTDPEPVWA